ncbi:MAG: hypothetical protein Q4C55_00820 [Eubacterium sp.]|nr:hypothetical protein [Eubacterium sp.]
MSDKNKRWYRLDNAGTMYSSIASARSSTVYRMTFGLVEAVDPEALQKALDNVMVRFPYFNVTLRRGFFWHYYEHSENRPRVERESHYPCKAIRQKKGVFPFRILYYGRYIHLEMSHTICDGYGGIAFMKPLIVEYFKIKEGIVCAPEQGCIALDAPVDPQEYEDAFKRIYQKRVPPPAKGEKAYHFPFELLDKGQYLLVTGKSPAKQVVALAKAHKCTVTQFITALYFDSIQSYILGQSKRKRSKYGRTRAKIAVNVPVDLRAFFPSKTLRNFFISLNPCIDLELGEYSLEELITFIKGYMELYINDKNISRYVSRNVRNEQLMVLRIIPLWVKRLLMPVIYKRYGERGYTSSVSNLGQVRLPEEIAARVESFEAFPPPSPGNKLKIVMASYGETMSISFGKTVRETDIEKIFFRKLRGLGVPVKIEGNQLNFYDVERR